MLHSTYFVITHVTVGVTTRRIDKDKRITGFRSVKSWPEYRRRDASTVRQRCARVSRLGLIHARGPCHHQLSAAALAAYPNHESGTTATGRRLPNDLTHPLRATEVRRPGASQAPAANPAKLGSP